MHWPLQIPLISIFSRGREIRSTHCRWKGRAGGVSPSSGAMTSAAGLNTAIAITSTKETMAIWYLNKEGKSPTLMLPCPYWRMYGTRRVYMDGGHLLVCYIHAALNLDPCLAFYSLSQVQLISMCVHVCPDRFEIYVLARQEENLQDGDTPIPKIFRIHSCTEWERDAVSISTVFGPQVFIYYIWRLGLTLKGLSVLYICLWILALWWKLSSVSSLDLWPPHANPFILESKCRYSMCQILCNEIPPQAFPDILRLQECDGCEVTATLTFDNQNRISSSLSPSGHSGRIWINSPEAFLEISHSSRTGVMDRRPGDTKLSPARRRNEVQLIMQLLQPGERRR